MVRREVFLIICFTRLKESGDYEHISNCTDRGSLPLCGICTVWQMACEKWGIDPKAKTPAVIHNDGQDYVPTDGWTVFAHQFSSIAGAGPVTGAIQAAAFGWLPVLLWIILGGIFLELLLTLGRCMPVLKMTGNPWGF